MLTIHQPLFAFPRHRSPAQPIELKCKGFFRLLFVASNPLPALTQCDVGSILSMRLRLDRLVCRLIYQLGSVFLPTGRPMEAGFPNSAIC